jgi:small GTP-binding protein
MQKKKICMVGDFSVGKTSLTQKFVNNVFSEKYLTTIGVKIDIAMVADTKLIVWDVAGRDSLSPINASYLVGASGIVLVADVSRASTLNGLPEIWQTVKKRIGSVPVVVALNKADLDGWQIDSQSRAFFDQQGWEFFETSAKDGTNVEAVFEKLVETIDRDLLSKPN